MLCFMIEPHYINTMQIMTRYNIPPLPAVFTTSHINSHTYLGFHVNLQLPQIAVQEEEPTITKIKNI